MILVAKLNPQKKQILVAYVFWQVKIKPQYLLQWNPEL